LEEIYQKNHMPAKTFGILEDGKRIFWKNKRHGMAISQLMITINNNKYENKKFIFILRSCHLIRKYSAECVVISR
jgi:hypothetical protein